MRYRPIAALVVGLLLALDPGSTTRADDRVPAGEFSPAGALLESRVGHTATALEDGRVLVVGGGPSLGGFAVTDTAELWDPATTDFDPAGRLAHGRSHHTATALSDGRVLVVGGLGPAGTTVSAEVWDPATKSFASTGSLAEARGEHTATLLPDGRVLVVGGAYLDLEKAASGYLGSAEVWDPATDAFTPGGSLAEARYDHSALLVPDGRVLVVGGSAGSMDPPTVAEIWDPAAATFVPAGPLALERQSYGAILASDGRVLLVGGLVATEEDLQSVEMVELWDPATGAVEPVSSLIAGRWAHTTTGLPDGRVLVTGGQDWSRVLASAEVGDRTSSTFTPAGRLVPARHSHTATLLPDGRVLIVGGWDPAGEGQGLADAEVWTPVGT